MVERGKPTSILVVSVLFSLVLSPSLSNHAFGDGGMQCYDFDGTGDMNFHCVDKADIPTYVIDYIYENGGFLKIFGDKAKVSDIRTSGSSTFAKVKIPIAPLIERNTEVKYYPQGEKYVIDFINGDFKHSKLTIMMKQTWSYDGKENGGTEISFDFIGKNLPLGAKKSHMKYVFDHGLDLLEKEGKSIQHDIPNPETKQQNDDHKKNTEQKQVSYKKNDEKNLRGPPIIDSDNDGISDELDLCDWEKETYNGLDDDDGCPDVVVKKNISDPTPIRYFGTSIELDQQFYRANDKVYITIFAPNFNSDSQNAEYIGNKANQRITVFTDSGKLDYYKLRETGTDTGIFVGEVQLTTDSSSSGIGPIDGKLSAVSSDKFEISFTEDFSGEIVSVTTTAEIEFKEQMSDELKSDYIAIPSPKLDPLPVPANHLKITSNKQYFIIGDTLQITGKATSSLSNVNIKISDPNGDLLKSFQATIENDFTFKSLIKLEKPWFTLTGNYVIQSWQSQDPIDQDTLTIKITVPGSEPVSPKLPSWIKNNAGWWADGIITDDDFIQGVEFMIKNKIIEIEKTNVNSNNSEKIPEWVKYNAKWWVDGIISEDDFVKGIQYLVKNGIVSAI